jgi:hypothetical protein
MPKTFLGGLIDANATLVGIVILAVVLTALVYLAGRIRRSGGG